MRFISFKSGSTTGLAVAVQDSVFHGLLTSDAGYPVAQRGPPKRKHAHLPLAEFPDFLSSTGSTLFSGRFTGIGTHTFAKFLGS